MYADLIIKPERTVLYRSSQNGGLNLVSVQLKAKACFIRNFIELTANQDFIQSIFLSMFFRLHILQEDVQCPPLPPYLGEEIFDPIRATKDSGLNIIEMSIKDWYKFLLFEAFSEEAEDGRRSKLCGVEQENDYNWSLIWRNSRLCCLDSKSTSFAFQFLHNLLPTEARLSHILPNSSPLCKFSCGTVSDKEHVFFRCVHSSVIGDWLLCLVENVDPGVTRGRIMTLDFDEGDALIWIIIQTLSHIWEQRAKGKRMTIPDITARIHSDAMILLETQHFRTATVILQYISV